MKKIERKLKSKKFGELTVIKKDYDYDNKKRWIVKCNSNKCGKEYSLSEHYLVYHNMTTCYDCAAKKRRLKNTINSTLWNNIKNRFRYENIEISPLMTKKYLWDLYIKQNKKCAISGKNIYLASSTVDETENTASLDRIDSSKGYFIDNIQWVHKLINIIKWDFPQDYFIELCGLIAKHNK